MKLTDQQVKMVMWSMAFVGICILIGLGKLPVDALKYCLLYAAGTFGGSVKIPGLTPASPDPPQPTQGPSQ